MMVIIRTIMIMCLGISENGLTGGNLHLTCWYKNRELYSNYWDLCTMEEDEPDRLIYCPIKRSHKYYVKDKKIPSYLPKVSRYYK